MDDQTSIVLALQLVALCCIACALVLYLLRRMMPRDSLQTKEVRNPFSVQSRATTTTTESN